MCELLSPARVVACIVMQMQHHLRDRRFTRSTTISQSAEDPKYRKLRTTDFLLSARTHNPVSIIKPISIANKVCSQLKWKMADFARRKYRGARLLYQIRVGSFALQCQRVEAPCKKFINGVCKIWRSAVEQGEQRTVLAMSKN